MEYELPYKEIVNYSVDAIIAIDDHYTVVLWNPAAETMFGYSRHEVIGKPLIDFIVPDRYKKAMKKGLGTFGKTGNGPIIGKTMQLEARRKNGSEFDIELSVSMVQTNKSSYVIGICRDSTETRKIERDIKESEERLRVLFEFAPDAYYLVDQKGTLIDVNRAAEVAIGDVKANLVGRRFLDLNIVPESHVKRAAYIFTKNLKGLPTGPDELRLRKRDGTEIYVEIRTYPVILRDENLILGIAHDISSRKKAGEEIRRERNFFESIVNSLPGIFYILDDTLRIVRWNKNLEKMTGYSGAELSKIDFFDLFDSDKRESMAEHVKEAFHRGQSKVETDLVSRDGNKTPFFLSATDVQVGDRRFLTGVGIDISERKEAETKTVALNELLFSRTIELRKSEIKWLSIYMTSKDVIYISTAGGKITDINPAGVALFGYTENEIGLIKAKSLYVNPDDRITFEKEIREKGYVQDFDVVYRRRDGTSVECLETAVVRKDESGTIIGYQGIIRDVSERNRLLHELEEAKVSAEQANRAKSQFLANMSHEIRTPMNAVLGFSELLMEEDLTKEQRESVSAIHESGRTLLNLINDILDLSKIESGAAAVKSEEFFLFELLNGVVAIIRLKAHKKEIDLELTIDPDTPPKIVTDYDKLRQILVNLASNAVKFTDKGGVYVSVHTDAVDNENVRLSVSVRDTGCGIPDDKLDMIFDPFTQADAHTTRKYGGTGLGLSITKRLVDLLGGEIEVSSEVDSGSVFTFRIPVQLPTSSSANVDEEPSNTIVIVEDDPITLKLYKHLFERNGFTVFSATHGNEAVSLIRKHNPALVILDILLPDISGWDVLQRLKRNERTADIPVIIISVLSEREKAISLGAIDYLEKPIVGDALINKIGLLRRIRGIKKRVRVLVIDDDKPVLDYLNEMLNEEGLDAIPFSDARSALEYLKSGNEVDVIILDIFLGDMTGFDFLLQLKHESAIGDVPVIFITGRTVTDQETAKLEGITHSLLDESQLNSQMILAQIENTINKLKSGSDDHTESVHEELGRKAAVLLVEDNELNRKLISKMLAGSDYEIQMAANGSDAVEMAKSGSFDLILMDIQMPVMDGYEATRLIKSDSRIKDTPIIALTAHAMKGEREKILDAGFDGYLTKPVKKDYLIREINDHLMKAMPADVSADEQQEEGAEDEELMDIFREFDESLSERYRELSEAAEKKDYDKIYRIGHDLKGSGGAFKREKISIIGRQIEGAAKQKNNEIIRFVLNSLAEEVERIANDSR